METVLTSLLASVAGGRRYWVRKPQSDPGRPYVVMQRATRLPNYHMKGASGYVFSRVQIDVYGDTFASTKAAADALKAVLSGYSSGIIQGAFLDGERDLPAADAGEVSTLFRISLDFTIHHGETP
jgi:hypothetical protein